MREHNIKNKREREREREKKKKKKKKGRKNWFYWSSESQ